MEFSVLLSVYTKENSKYLKQSLESLMVQEVTPTEIILVEDGPLTPELNQIIELFTQKMPIESVRLAKNGGLASALNVGLKKARYDFVARIDTDDIALPSRFKLQIENFTRGSYARYYWWLGD